MTPAHVAARWAVVIAVTFVLQMGLISQIRIFGVIPDVMVVLAVCAGLSGGGQRGAVVGFWIGLIFDLPRTEHPLGLSALAYLLIAFAVGVAQVVVLQSGRIISTAIVAAGSALGILLFAVESQFFGGNALTNPDLWRIVVVTALVGAAMSRIGLRVAGWADGPETRSAAEPDHSKPPSARKPRPTRQPRPTSFKPSNARTLDQPHRIWKPRRARTMPPRPCRNPQPFR